jgi:hypothetical protein
MFFTILVIALVVAFVAVMVWFAINRDGNGSENLPEGGQTNPPVNGTGLFG